MLRSAGSGSGAIRARKSSVRARREWNDAYQIIDYNWIGSSRQTPDSATDNPTFHSNLYFPFISAQFIYLHISENSNFFQFYIEHIGIIKMTKLFLIEET